MTSAEKSSKLAALDARIKALQTSITALQKEKSTISSQATSEMTEEDRIILTNLIPEAIDINNLNYVEDNESNINIKVTIELMKELVQESEDVTDFISAIKEGDLKTEIKTKYKHDLGLWLDSGTIDFFMDRAMKFITKEYVTAPGKQSAVNILTVFFNKYK